MSLILYPATETAFDTNGIGILTDATDAEVYEELNGQYELTVQYPITGIHFADIVADAFITAKPNPVTGPQPFRIYHISKPMRGIVTINARHNAYRLGKVVAAPFTATSAIAALQGVKNNAVNDCPFDFWTDKTTEAEMKVSVPKDIWSLLGNSTGSILDNYGGEYEFDCFTVKLHNHRGIDRGVSIRYGKNLTDFKQDENVANVYTGIYPYWTDTEGNLVQLPEKYINGPGTYTEEKIKPLDLSQEFKEKPTETQLRTRAVKYIKDNDIGKPDISWTVEFVQLEQTEEYKGKALLERVLLGDTVSVIFPILNVDVSARAVATRYKPLLKRYKNVTLGKVKADLAIAMAQQSREIRDKSSMSQLEQAREAATNWLTNGKGYVVQVKNSEGQYSETLYMDSPDANTAVNVMRLNNTGIGFSHTGINGPYTSAWTIDGKFNADVVLTGTLFGILIKACRIESANGKVALDLSDESKISTFNTGISTNGLIIRADAANVPELFRFKTSYGRTADEYYGRMWLNNVEGKQIFLLTELFTTDFTELAGVAARWYSPMNDIWTQIDSGTTSGLTLYKGAEGDGPVPVSGYFYQDENGISMLGTEKINGKTINWSDNGDGTFTLLGR